MHRLTLRLVSLGVALLVLTPAVHPVQGAAQVVARESGHAPAQFAAHAPAQVMAQAGPELIVLVRHAEKALEPADNPPLSAEGRARAAELARVLAEAGITRIHSTDTRRTLETAAPLAQALGIEVEIYDGRDLPALVARLLQGAAQAQAPAPAQASVQTPGRHLVVGHSNTTDRLSGLLGGTTFGELVEAWEYDRLYVLTSTGGGGFTTVLTRFGAIPPR